MRRITADSTTLMDQAWKTASDYLGHAIREIDDKLGEGYAKQHSDLIAAFMYCETLDFGEGIIAGALEEIAEALESLADAMPYKD